jgi:biotin operon repressor
MFENEYGGKEMSENKQAENWVSMKEITQYLDVSRETVLQ